MPSQKKRRRQQMQKRGGRRAVARSFPRCWCHTPLYLPRENDELPFMRQDYVSKAFYWPVSGEEVLSFLRNAQVSGLTHVWLRRPPVERGLAFYASGWGIRSIVLHPWRSDSKMRIGERKPTRAWLRHYQKRWGPELILEDSVWHLWFDPSVMRRFYVEGLLLHEIGHYYHHRWRTVSYRGGEHAADQYADAFVAAHRKEKGDAWYEAYLQI